jgi:hypothetical protein
MPRVEAIRSEIKRLIKASPFQQFAIRLENGDQVLIEHPENIAFDPGSNGDPGSDEFYVLSRRIRLFSSFSAVTSVALVDRGET